MIDDPQVPVRDLLIGPDAVDVLDVAVSQNGGVCTSAKARQIRYVPGSAITVQYDTTVRWDSETASDEILVAHFGGDLPANSVRLEIGGAGTAVWRYPDDPHLPGLVPATSEEAVLGILHQLGVDNKDVKLRLRAYRAGRRAVIEALSDETRLFIKVVRPSRVQRLQEVHKAAAGRVPVPHSYGWADELGIVVIEALPGETLRRAIGRPNSELPAGSDLANLLDLMTPIQGLKSRTVGPVERLDDHARLIGTIVPQLEERLGGLVDRIAASPAAQEVVHGDFHTSQVITERGGLVGLIDLDTMGMGCRSDDYATMVGQISTLAIAGAEYRSYGDSLIKQFDRLVDPIDLRYRTAAVVIGFATGPFRVQMRNWEIETEKRIRLAERWVDAAESGVSA